jgi:hypothetical protein
MLRPFVSRDAGGGVSTTYAPILSSVPCSIATASATEIQRFATRQIRVTHTIAFRQDVLTVGVLPGYVLEADDTGHRYRIQGIRAGRPYNAVPAFTYCDCEHII